MNRRNFLSCASAIPLIGVAQLPSNISDKRVIIQFSFQSYFKWFENTLSFLKHKELFSTDRFHQDLSKDKICQYFRLPNIFDPIQFSFRKYEYKHDYGDGIERIIGPTTIHYTINGTCNPIYIEETSLEQDLWREPLLTQIVINNI